MLIRCPAPLPEDSTNALLTRMLTPTPYQVSAEEGENREAGGGLCPKDKSDVVFGETETLLPEGKGAEEAFHGKKGPLLKVRRGNLPRKGKRHRRAAWAGQVMLTWSFMMRINLWPNRKCSRVL